MKLLIFTLLIFFNLFTVISAQEYDSYEVQRFREIREKSFRDRNSTPLLQSDFEKFEGLQYFPISANYAVKAVLRKATDSKSLLMPTSTGGSRKYLKIGVLHFKLNGQELSLTAFVNETDAKEEIRELFVPFRDLTNTAETYGAGRYLYLRMPKDKAEAILDFNLSYNPNCAYNSNFACTLPPKENFLQVEIRAGEKIFKAAVGINSMP